MRRFLIATAALVVVAALALLGTRLLMSDTAAHGPLTGNVDLVGIDMDITGNGGSAAGGILGVRETCGEIVGTGTLDIDITVDEVGTDKGISGFQYTLNFGDGSNVHVTGTAFALSLLNLDPDSAAVTSFSDVPPETDGTYLGSVADMGGPAGIDDPPFTADGASSESGEGILERLTLTGVSAGTVNLTLTSVGVADDAGGQITINTIASAIVVVDGAGCPEADLSVAQTLDPVGPVTADASTNVIVDVDKDIDNLGPLDDVAGTLTTTVTVPPGCEANGSAGPSVVITQVVPPPPLGLLIGTGPAHSMTETLTLHCAVPGSKVFTIENDVQPIGTTDSSQGNNVVSDTFTINSNVYADVGITGWAISSAPAPSALPILVPRICMGLEYNAALWPLIGAAPNPAFYTSCVNDLTMGTALIKTNVPVDVDKVVENLSGYTPVDVDVTPTGTFQGSVNIPCYVVASFLGVPQKTLITPAGVGFDCDATWFLPPGTLGPSLFPVGMLSGTPLGPPECSVSSPSAYMVSVGAVPVPSTENFTVNCQVDSFGIEMNNPQVSPNMADPMAFVFNNEVQPNDSYVIDTPQGNNTADPPLLLWAVPAFNPTFQATIDDTDAGNPLTYPATDNCVIIQACEFLTDYGVPLAQQETALGITYIPQATVAGPGSPTNGFVIASGHPLNAALGPGGGAAPSVVWAGPGLTNGSQVGVFTFSVHLLAVAPPPIPGTCTMSPVSGIDVPLYDGALPGTGPSLLGTFPAEGPNFPVAGITGTAGSGSNTTICDTGAFGAPYDVVPGGNLQGMTVRNVTLDETRQILSHDDDCVTVSAMTPFSSADPTGDSYAVGEGSELASPFVWPDRLDSDMTIQNFVAGGAPVWARYVGFVSALGAPTNTIVFNMGSAGYASFSATGDPSAPPGSGTPLCTPMSVKGIIQGEAFNIGTATTDRTRECEQSGAYPIAQDFIRAATTLGVTIVDTVNCTAENDISLANLDKDEDLGDGAPSWDIIHTGLPAGPYTVTFDVTNGALPADLEVELSIISADGCIPQWVGGDLSIVNGVATSVLTDRAGLPNPFLPGASAGVSYDYNLTCTPGGFHELQIVANVRSYVPTTLALFTDPTPGDAQAENHPEAFADDDVDGDTIPTPGDNCPDDANPGQENFDGDSEGDECDDDDDNDGVDDPDDDCDFVAEDHDGSPDIPEDGCPDTDASVSKTTPPTVQVDVSETDNVPITVTVTNGNYEADVRVNLTAISLLGVCEVRLNPDLGAGDAYAEFTTDEDGNTVDETLFSMIERVETSMGVGESRDVVRSYDIHCFDRSDHSGLVEIQADVVPMAPVVEEDVTDNVEKNYPDITAIDQADLKKVSLEVIGYDSATPYDCAVVDPLPATIEVSENVTLCVYQSMHNNGPVEAAFTDVLTVTAPTNCTALPPTTNVAGSLLNGQTWGTTVPIVIHCTEPSFHGPFTFNNTISVNQLHTEDREPGNDSKSTNLPLVAVVGEADILVDPVVILSPGSINVSEHLVVTVNATITNLGPSTPVDVSWDIDASVAAQCTLTPTSPIAGTILDLAGAQMVSATYDLHCLEGSYHVITADASAWLVADPHISEIDPGSDNTDVAATPTTVQSIATADIKVQSVDCPDLLWAPDNNVAVASSVTSTIHNNGPDHSTAAKQVVIDSATCSINGLVPPDVGIPVIINVAESDPAGVTKVEVDPFNVDIPAGSSCWYSVDVTKLAAADPHIIDNEPGNNNGSDDCLLCLDTDGDEVGNPGGDALCGDDNCPDDPNGPAQAAIPGVGNQTDTDGDGVGDACDDTPFHDPDVKDRNFVVLGPAAVNLSDTNGRYMWVIAEVGNFSGHDELVQIALNLDIPAGLAANCVATPTWPNAGVVTSLILPGQDTFIMLAGEQKFVAWRVRFECHASTVPGVYTIGGTVNITHLDIGGTHTGDEDTAAILPHDHAPDHMGIGNNKSFSKEIIIE